MYYAYYAPETNFIGWSGGSWTNGKWSGGTRLYETINVWKIEYGFDKVISSINYYELINIYSGDTVTYNQDIYFNYLGGVDTTATIILSGVSFVIKSVSGSTNEELIWDFGGVDEHNFGSGSTGSITISVNGTLFNIVFKRGSLTFGIINVGLDPNHVPNGNPHDLTLTVLSDTSIQCNWINGSTNEDGLSIERSINGISYSEIVRTTNGIITYSNTGLTEGTIYYYRIRAFKGIYNSIYSNTAQTETYLITPSNLVATTISSSEIDLTWQDNSVAESGYKVEQSIDSGLTYSVIYTTISGVISYNNTGLTNGTLYYYRVRAFNYTEYSDYCTPASNYTILPSPTSLTVVTDSDTQQTLTWVNGATNQDGTKIFASLTPNFGFVEVYHVVGGFSTAILIELTVDTGYYYNVRHYKGSILSEPCETVYSKTFTSEAQTIILKAIELNETPNYLTKLAIDYLVKNLQTNLLWSDEDCLEVYRSWGENSSLIDWHTGLVRASKQKGAGSFPTFANNFGWTTDGVQNFLNSGFNLSLGVNYTQDNSGVIYRTAKDTGSTGYAFGVYGSATAKTHLIRSAVGNHASIAINGSSKTTVNTGSSDTIKKGIGVCQENLHPYLIT